MVGNNWARMAFLGGGVSAPRTRKKRRRVGASLTDSQAEARERRTAAGRRRQAQETDELVRSGELSRVPRKKRRSRRAKLAKGSPAAKRRMAQLRAMRRK